MERIKQLLKITSEFRSHRNNMAKEYIFLENGEFLTLGIECLIFNNDLFRIITKEDSNLSMIKVVEKYTLCYGISLTNIITLLSNKEILIIGINTFKDYNGNREYVITLKEKYSPIQSFSFKETNDLKSFEDSELGYFICNLYEI